MPPEIELTLETLIYGGAALGRHEGRAIFVPYALPGERVRVRVTQQHKTWAQAELIAVLEPSPDRVIPRCPHFGPGKCGGCQWQHASYPAQLAAKTAIVQDQLRRIGKFAHVPVRPCLASPDDGWHYRNHVQLGRDKRGQVGFVSENRRAIHPIDVCFIMNPSVYDLFQTIQNQALPPELRRVALRGSTHTGDQLVIGETTQKQPPQLALPPNVSLALRLDDGDPETPSTTVAVQGEPHLSEILGQRRWHISAGSFFQTNTPAAEMLLQVVRDLVGPLTGQERLLDAFAGVGTFGLALAPHVATTWLVESHPQAIADAAINAQGIPTVEIIAGRAEDVIPAWNNPRPDIVLLDPPRAGCAPALLSALCALAIPRLIYVSCDPATLARDLRQLVDGGYSLDVVQPVDMFPQTFHVETATLLTRPA